MSKYGAIKTVVDGITFASRAEANRYCVLSYWQSQGKISDLKVQPKFPLWFDGKPLRACDGMSKKTGKPIKGKQITPVMDFSYIDNGGIFHVEDVKGCDNPNSKLKRALVQHATGLVVEIVK